MCSFIVIIKVFGNLILSDDLSIFETTTLCE